MKPKTELLQLAAMQRDQNYLQLAVDLLRDPIFMMVAGVCLINGVYQATSTEYVDYADDPKGTKKRHTPIYSESVRQLMQSAAIGYPAIAAASKIIPALAPLIPAGISILSTVGAAAGGAAAGGAAAKLLAHRAATSPLSIPAYGAPRVSTWGRFLAWLKAPWKTNVMPVYMTERQIKDFKRRYGTPDYYEG